MDANTQPQKRQKRKNYDGFEMYIGRMLKQTHPDIRMSSAASNRLDAFVKVLISRISSEAYKLVSIQDKQTITSREIQSGVRIVFPNEIAKGAVSGGTVAVRKYNADITEMSDHDEQKRDVKEKPKSASRRADVTFPVARCRKYISKECGKTRIGIGAPVYLAGVLDYVMGELLQLSGDVAKEKEKKTIYTKHIFRSVSENKNFLSLFKSINIEFNESGVVPEENIKRATTKAQKDTKKYQNSTVLLIQKAPFDRIVRSIVHNNIMDDCGFSNNVITSLQGFIESSVVHLFTAAHDFSLHAGREGIKEDDIRLALKYLYNNVPLDVEVKPLKKAKGSPDVASKTKEPSPIPNAAFVRLARRAGVMRMAADAYDISRDFVNGLSFIVMNNAMTCTEHMRMKIVKIKALNYAVKSLGYNYIF